MNIAAISNASHLFLKVTPEEKIAGKGVGKALARGYPLLDLRVQF